jgi:hypothetical protein
MALFWLTPSTSAPYPAIAAPTPLKAKLRINRHGAQDWPESPPGLMMIPAGD